jgi:hypothetical protein
MAPRHRTRIVVGHTDSPETEGEHDQVTRTAIATKIAALAGYEFAGDYDPARSYPLPLYFVPSHTIVGFETAHALGIRDEEDLFGGVVPHAFVATKSITHPLVDARAREPVGWSRAFPARVRDVVLDGLSAFSADDAHRAGALLLERGPVRVKPAGQAGGRGQVIVDDMEELDTSLGELDEREVQTFGIVLEQNLRDVETYSVGQVQLCGLVATYSGIQKLTQDNAGRQVYGGSDLLVVRGGFDALLALELTPSAHMAVAQARIYDAAAREELGFFGSRRNYDVARGFDSEGRVRYGVLEQSWRIGGATVAELAALAAFCERPSLTAVHGRGFEMYGELVAAPPRATVFFSGVDHTLGRVVKYSVVEEYVGTR